MNLMILRRVGHPTMQPCRVTGHSSPRESRMRLAMLGLAVGGALSLGPTAASAAPFDELSPTAQATIIQRCLPVRYDAGVEAWRTCIDSESIAASDTGNATSSASISALDLDERFALRKLCENSADADCTARALIQLSRTPPPVLNDLRDDEQHALSRACFAVQSTEGPAAWRQCMTEQADILRAEAPVDLAGLSLAQRNDALNTCSDTDSVLGYRDCLAREGAPLQRATSTAVASGAPVVTLPETTTTNTAEPASQPGTASSAIDTTPQAGTDRAPAVTLPGVEQAPEPVATPEVAAAQPASINLPSLPADEPASGSDDRPGDAAVNRQTAATDSTAGEPAQTVTQGGELDGPTTTDAGTTSGTTPGLVERVSSAINDLDPVGRATLMAAVALPFLALLGIAMTRRRSRAEDRTGEHRLIDRVRSTPGDNRDAGPYGATRVEAGSDGDAIRDRFRDEADDLFDSLEQTIASTPLETVPADVMAHNLSANTDRHRADHTFSDETFADDTGDAHELSWDSPEMIDLPEQAAGPTSNAGDRTPDARTPDARMPDARMPEDSEAPTRLVTPPGASLASPASGRDTSPRSATFVDWLMTQPESRRFQHCVELLVYWTAYADERYDPQAREAVLSNPEPDAHDRIKAWVLRKDSNALSDSLRWLLHNSSREQRVQVLELLVALLVTDAEPTPAQNTLLRFFSDVFGMGEKRLQQLWNTAFGAELPVLPRVDRPDWWNRQQIADMCERDARDIARQSPERQYRLQLGLPLHDPVSTADIQSMWSRAAARCSPERFDALGSRERKLAERQLQRFTEARDGLLEHATDIYGTVEQSTT